MTCDFTNREEGPGIWKRAGKITKYTAKGNTRNKPKYSLIAALILPETRHREDLNNIENKSIEYYAGKSKQYNFTRDFPTIHLSKYITKNIWQWKEDSTGIQCQTGKLCHFCRRNIWDNQDDTKKCHKNSKSEWIHAQECIVW